MSICRYKFISRRFLREKKQGMTGGLATLAEIFALFAA
jgi:hypothetical protein